MLPNGLEKSALKPLPRIRRGPTMHRNIYSRFSLVSADREEIHTPLQANMEETLGQDNETTGQTQTASSACEERSSHDENIATASITPALNELQDSVNMEATQIHQERERKRQTHQLYEARRRQGSVFNLC
ncbi:hypothetical protein AGOR_G00195420 [Albula goreensis]|uniref:Uncharacterized protein n=1 Tax=Albula goreensis TaxID=1534307 RepID=A0A8T3CW83_9TELE|nr:hypothetical protein AGOR_G00195420 [Albula goreensis]